MAKLIETKKDAAIDLYTKDSATAKTKRVGEFSSDGGGLILGSAGIDGAAGSESDNIKLHRGGSQLLQILIATDGTDDGLSAPAVSQASIGVASLTTPILIGGSGTTQTLTYKTTTGVGTTGADHIFQVGNNGATEAMRIINNGSVGIGATPSAGYTLKVSKGLSDAATVIGISSDGNISTTIPTQFYGIKSTTSVDASAVNLTSVTNFNASSNVLGITPTNQYGFSVDASLIYGTNNYGFYGNIPAGSNRYNIHMAGTANNYLNGAVGIGSTVVGGSTGYKGLKVGLDQTGSVSTQAISFVGTVQSDVTAMSQIYKSSVSTQAAAFSLASLLHYTAEQGSLGAGSSIVDQYGFYTAGLTNATNNYGFYAYNAAATGRWNFYAAGTANNYFGGSVGIGIITPDANAALDVTSTTKAFLPPRMTTVQKNAIPSPTVGMEVFDLTQGLLSYYNGSAWSTKSTFFDALSPMSAGGDLIYGGASGTGTRLPNGTAGQVLKSAGTTLAPVWADILPVGSIIQSMLTEAQFQATSGAGWILADGRSVVGSSYTTITGFTSAPDARGRVLRGKNNGSLLAQHNQDGDSALGWYQGDDFYSHNHAQVSHTHQVLFEVRGVAAGNTYHANYIESYTPPPTSMPTDTAQPPIQYSGGTETRMRNITINIFIRIN